MTMKLAMLFTFTDKEDNVSSMWAAENLQALLPLPKVSASSAISRITITYLLMSREVWNQRTLQS